MTIPNYDVIVAGSGPAGSTAATLLAQRNHKVLIIERSRHPRFHIGESMLPLSTPVFNRLGIQWDRKRYLHKNGAQFIDEKGGQQVRFCLNGQYQPYQVERACFDHMLVNNAVSHGVELQQEESVRAVDIDTDSVQVTTDLGRYCTRYLIDATGRSTLMGRKQTGIERIENLGRFALYTHYRNASSTTARELYLAGDIKVLMVDIGWIWIIPLIDSRLSIGLVVQQPIDSSQRGAALYEHYKNASPILTELLAGAEQETAVRAEADFSFINTRRHGRRYACCGDAAGFLDPIFSSGVFLAVTSAERVADRMHPALANGTEGDPTLHAADDDHYNLGFRSMQLFVERYYQYDMVHHLFFEADRSEDIKNDIAALLSGDLWRGNNEFQRMLLEGRQNRGPGARRGL
ncbi:MAG: NAD(P)/FAD-dependent oxidoreductase [Gammaproteobacteria bacterium]|nr:NAD(P)/FAD-dependent oxidoreductase [Gammaproteobacteria bacterium]